MRRTNSHRASNTAIIKGNQNVVGQIHFNISPPFTSDFLISVLIGIIGAMVLFPLLGLILLRGLSDSAFQELQTGLVLIVAFLSLLLGFVIGIFHYLVCDTFCHLMSLYPKPKQDRVAFGSLGALIVINSLGLCIDPKTAMQAKWMFGAWLLSGILAGILAAKLWKGYRPLRIWFNRKY